MGVSQTIHQRRKSRFLERKDTGNKCGDSGGDIDNEFVKKGATLEAALCRVVVRDDRKHITIMKYDQRLQTEGSVLLHTELKHK